MLAQSFTYSTNVSKLMGGFRGTLRSRCPLLESFSNNDGDRNENVKKDVKMPNFTFYRRLKPVTTIFSFFF